MKRIYKYATGASVPEGAVFLSTITYEDQDDFRWVWHYFLVEVTE